MSTDQPTTNDSTAQQPTPIDFADAIEVRMDSEEEDGSHTEFDPRVFHPSSVGYTEWLLTVNKLGLSDKSDLKGTFKMGELIHEYVQEALTGRDSIDWRDIEVPVEFEEDGLVFTGHADVYDETRDIVYDIKSRSNWYHFDPPVDRHLDQLHTYMRGLDADYGQVVYISKKDMEVRAWPEGAPFTFDESRWLDIKARCMRVRDALYEHGFPQSEAEIPFEKPGDDHDQSYFVESTELDFSSVNGEVQ